MKEIITDIDQLSACAKQHYKKIASLTKAAVNHLPAKAGGFMNACKAD